MNIAKLFFGTILAVLGVVNQVSPVKIPVPKKPARKFEPLD